MTGAAGSVDTGFFSVTGKLLEAAQGKINDVSDFAKEMDPTNQSDVAKMQTLLAEMNITLGLESAVVKSVEDSLKTVVQRM